MSPEELDAWLNDGQEAEELNKTEVGGLQEDASPKTESPSQESSLAVQPEEVVKPSVRPELARLNKLYQLFGRVAIVPLGYGKKGPEAVGWQSVTFEASQAPDYQNRICDCFTRGGNLGLLLGPASDNLVDIDIDRAEWVQPFLDANPLLQTTLRRVGKARLRNHGPAGWPFSCWPLGFETD